MCDYEEIEYRNGLYQWTDADGEVWLHVDLPDAVSWFRDSWGRDPK